MKTMRLSHFECLALINEFVFWLGESATTPDDLLDLIAGMQSKRMDEQRVELPHLPGLQKPRGLQRLSDAAAVAAPDDTFLEMLMRCQGSRLEDQRSALPVDEPDLDDETQSSEPSRPTNRGPTVPDEDFFSLIMRLQSGRMEDQRASVPSLPRLNSNPGTSTGALPKTTRKEKKKWLTFSAPSSIDFKWFRSKRWGRENVSTFVYKQHYFSYFLILNSKIIYRYWFITYF